LTEIINYWASIVIDNQTILVDALRGGNTRERKIASVEIQKRFDYYNGIEKSEY
jgi:hypothetical protein